MSQARSFLFKLLVISIGFVIVDVVAGMIFHSFYFRIRHGEQGRLNYTIDSTVAPVLVLGSSRAAHHYVSDIISDSMNRSCYNAGKDKQGIFYQLAILKAVLHRYRPRIIIVDMMQTALHPSEAGLDELAVLLPYYRDHPGIREIINKRSKWERIKTCSSLYCYNSLLLQTVFNSLSNSRDAGVSNGYLPNYNILDHAPIYPISYQQETGKVDSGLTNSFEEMITLAQQNRCQIVVVVSPSFYALPNGTSTIRSVKEITARRQVPFLNYSDSAGFWGNSRLFSDEEHLNDTGARMFTSLLCRDLARICHRTS